MWWKIFTAVDLYIGLVILKSLGPGLPESKQKRVAVVEKVVIAGLIISAIAIVFDLLRR